MRGQHNGIAIDNTTEDELAAWLNLISEIKPAKVMVYAIERDTAAHNLVKLPKDELEQIAQKVRQLGIETEVFA